MNRADKIRAVLVCEAVVKQLRADLGSDARAEYEKDGTVPTWKLPGVTVSSSTSNPSAVVTDEKAFTDWVAQRYPTEVETITRVRDVWRSKLLGDAVAVGEAISGDGEEMPGVEVRPGGEYRSVSFIPKRDLKAELAVYAADIAAGVRPLALPSGDDGEEAR